MSQIVSGFAGPSIQFAEIRVQPNSGSLGWTDLFSENWSVIGARSMFGTDLRPPFVEFSLGSVDDFRGDHAGYGKYKDADEDLIGLKSCAGDRDHKSDTGSGGIKFSDHDADQSPPDRQSQPREYKGNRRRNHHALEYLPFRSAKASGGGEQVGGRGLDAVASVDEQREYRAKENDAHFGQNADAQPNNDQ